MKLITKFGTNAIFDSQKQEIKKPILEQIAKNTKDFLEQPNNELIIVSSGAVGCGKGILPGKNGIGTRQAQAAIGQPILMQEYQKAFKKYNLNIAQLLLTYDDLGSISKTKNIINAYSKLKQNNVIPIVNENDTTAIEELSIGDNDKLATQLLLALDFDTLINYTERGPLIQNGKPIHLTSIYNPKEYDSIQTSGTGFGGLKSKLESAKLARDNGKEYIIAKAGDSIYGILSDDPAEIFLATRFL